MNDIAWLNDQAVIYHADADTGIIYTCRRSGNPLADNGAFHRSIDESIRPVSPLSYKGVQVGIARGELFLFATKADAEHYLEATAPVEDQLLIGDIVLITGTKTVPSDFLGQLAVVTETFTETDRVLIQVKATVGRKASLSCGANRNEIRRVGHDPSLLNDFAQTTFLTPEPEVSP